MTPHRLALERHPRASTLQFVARTAVALLLGVLLSADATPLHAQQTGKGFFFRKPVISLALRGGFANGGFGGDSSVYAFARRELTLGRGAFNAPAMGAELSFHLSSRIDLAIGTALAASNKGSEMRDWVDQDDLPIEQTTSLKRVPVTASLKVYLTQRGHSIGQYAWVPARHAIYAGVGGGAMWYRFHQEGDFVDFNSPAFDIFTSSFTSAGWTSTTHVMAGFDRSLSTRLVLNTEARYTWARAELSDHFRGFDPIDLSGLSTTIGLNIRF